MATPTLFPSTGCTLATYTSASLRMIFRTSLSPLANWSLYSFKRKTRAEAVDMASYSKFVGHEVF